MTAPLILALFALATACLAPRHLLRAKWVLRSPSGGILAWQAVSLAVVSSTILIGLTLGLPILPIGRQLNSLVRTTHLDVTDHYATPAGNGLAILALVAATVLLIRVLWLFVGSLRRAALYRRRQIEALRIVGAPHPSGFTVIEHGVPLVYCLPGRQGAVVVTSAALNALSSAEMESVLAHERRHLRARHDLALALSGALARTFVGVSLFRTAHEQVAILVEMQADDAARSLTSRRAMATALITLGATVRPAAAAGDSPGSALSRVRRLTAAQGHVPTRHRAAVRFGALGGGTTVGPAAAAGDSPGSALSRVRRLTAAQGRVPTGQRAAVGFGALALLAAPVALALSPALEASARDCCHVASPAGPFHR